MKKLLLMLLISTICMSSSCKKSNDTNCIGEKKTDCIYTMQYDPVCGCNNKTYGNECEALCNGVKTYTKGACR